MPDLPNRPTPFLLNRRRVLGLGLTGGLALSGAAAWTATRPAAAATTYDLVRDVGSYGDEGNYSDGPELITYAATGVRGGLWVHDAAVGSVENGSLTDPFHRGDQGHNVRRVRARSRRSFRQGCSVLVRGRTLWYDPLGGRVIGGVTRSANGGLKVLLGHHSNDNNYAVLLIRKSGYVTIQREFGHAYTTLANVSYPTPIETYRSFKITWADDRISVYHRHAEDGSDDRLIVQTAAGAAPGVYRGISYDNQPIGLYLDGAAVRMAYLRVRQA
ncbi:hypothetical protein [Microlunatus sp. GCM10028923]|uniref:hypothetical protein n=1 Tax=Microlunatus sp. GCM10028923 TaxID=3273400 RepID=UPI003616DAEB